MKGIKSGQGKQKKRTPQIGDIYKMQFDGSGSEQRGWRPGLVFQNNLGNKYSPNIIALPLTSSIKKTDQPTHVIVPAEGTGLARDSMILCENPQRMSKDKLGDYITTLPPEYMSRVAEANLLATSAISFINPDMLVFIWRQAATLNTAVG